MKEKEIIEIDRKLLKDRFEKVVYEYVYKFALKQDLGFDGFIGNRIGETATFGDYFFDLSFIRYDINNDIPKGKILDWYDYAVSEINPILSYEHWLKSNINK